MSPAQAISTGVDGQALASKEGAGREQRPDSCCRMLYPECRTPECPNQFSATFNVVVLPVVTLTVALFDAWPVAETVTV